MTVPRNSIGVCAYARADAARLPKPNITRSKLSEIASVPFIIFTSSLLVQLVRRSSTLLSQAPRTASRGLRQLLLRPFSFLLSHPVVLLDHLFVLRLLFLSQ